MLSLHKSDYSVGSFRLHATPRNPQAEDVFEALKTPDSTSARSDMEKREAGGASVRQVASASARDLLLR